MDVATARRLAGATRAWASRRGVGPTHIARHGKLSRTTIDAILNAAGREVSRETLRKLAVGLAAERRPPHPQDESVREQIYRDLHRAAGYGDVPGDLPDTFLETALYYTVGTMERAQAWKGAIERLAGLRPDEIDRLGRTTSAAE